MEIAMDPATWIAFGMFVVAIISLVVALTRRVSDARKQQQQDYAELVKARTEMNIGSIEAAERVISIYGVALNQAHDRISKLENELRRLRDNE